MFWKSTSREQEQTRATLSTLSSNLDYSPTRFFEEVAFPLQAYHLHPFEQVPDFVMGLGVGCASKGDEELVSA